MLIMGVIKTVEKGDFTIWCTPMVNFSPVELHIAPEMDGEITDVFVSALKEESLVFERQGNVIKLRRPSFPHTMFAVRGRSNDGQVRATCIGRNPDRPAIERTIEGGVMQEFKCVVLNAVPGSSIVQWSKPGDLYGRLRRIEVHAEEALKKISINDIVVGCQSLYADSASVPATFFYPGNNFVFDDSLHHLGSTLMAFRIENGDSLSRRLEITLHMECTMPTSKA